MVLVMCEIDYRGCYPDDCCQQKKPGTVPLAASEDNHPSNIDEREYCDHWKNVKEPDERFSRRRIDSRCTFCWDCPTTARSREHIENCTNDVRDEQCYRLSADRHSRRSRD